MNKRKRSDVEDWVLSNYKQPTLTSDVTLEIQDEVSGETVCRVKAHRFMLSRAKVFRTLFFPDSSFAWKEKETVQLRVFKQGMHTPEIIQEFFSFFYESFSDFEPSKQASMNCFFHHHLAHTYNFEICEHFFLNLISEKLSTRTVGGFIQYAHVYEPLPKERSLLSACVQWLKVNLRAQSPVQRVDLVSGLPFENFREMLLSVELPLNCVERSQLLDGYRDANHSRFASQKMVLLEMDLLKRKLLKDDDILGERKRPDVFLMDQRILVQECFFGEAREKIHDSARWLFSLQKEDEGGEGRCVKLVVELTLLSAHEGQHVETALHFDAYVANRYYTVHHSKKLLIKKAVTRFSLKDFIKLKEYNRLFPERAALLTVCAHFPKLTEPLSSAVTKQGALLESQTPPPDSYR